MDIDDRTLIGKLADVGRQIEGLRYSEGYLERLREPGFHGPEDYRQGEIEAYKTIVKNGRADLNRSITELRKYLAEHCELAPLDAHGTRVVVSKDGDRWAALVGPNLQEGVAGFGDTPAEALRILADAVEEEGYEFEE